MARIVDASDDDDDLPDLATLLRGTPGRNQGPRSAVVVPKSKENKPTRAQQPSSEFDQSPSTDLKIANGGVQNVEDKKKPRKRILNKRNDNPLLKPFSANTSDKHKPSILPTKRSVKSRELPPGDKKSTRDSTKSITILDSDDEGLSRAVSIRKFEDPSGNVAREKKAQTRRNLRSKEEPKLGSLENDLNEASMSTIKKTTRTAQKERNLKDDLKYSAESSKPTLEEPLREPPRENFVTEIMQIAERFDNDSLDISHPRKEAKAASEKAEIEESSASDPEDLSNFVVRDSISLNEEDSVIAMPPPRSVRRLMKGRRPKRSDDSDEESFTAKGRVTETPRLSSTTRLAKNLDLFRSSDREGLPRVLTNARKSWEVSTELPKCFENALILDLKGLSLGDSILSDQRPTKAPQQQEFTTPPGTPILKPTKLKSPTKKFSNIPKSPHRPSMDSFWDPEIINEWNDQYSPEKILKTFRLDDEAPKETTPMFSPKKSPVKQGRIDKDAKKAFSEKKHALAESFLIELDEVLTKGRVSELSASTGGIKIIWSKKLNTTAGRANWKRETMRSTSTQGTPAEVTHRHHASIELAEKVIDDEERLLNVIAHEFCHLANFMISNIKTNPHGKEFKEWAAKCSRHFGDRGIEVTTKHSYEIDYKYVWECENCGLEFKRHSKSIDPVKHQCGSCKSKLVQTKPMPRANPAGSVKKASDYQTFMKENMSKVREENPGSPQKDVLGLVAKRYREFKTLKLKAVDTVGSEMGEGARKKEVVPGDSDVVKSLERQLNFLDLTSP